MELKIDSTDKKIIKLLSKNARMKATELAEKIGMTSAAIHQRLAKIQREGYIKGYSVELDEKLLGYSTCAFVGVFMDRNSQYRDILTKLNKIDEIVECHYTTGVYGLFVKLYAKDNDHLMDVLHEKVQAIKGVTRTETFISLEKPIDRNVAV